MWSKTRKRERNYSSWTLYPWKHKRNYNFPYKDVKEFLHMINDIQNPYWKLFNSYNRK